MKNFNSDSSSALSRFAKDKRLRTERTATRSERPASTRSERPKRASFNPNFTDDNRPKRDGFKSKGGKFENKGKFEGKPKFDNKGENRGERTFKGKSEGFKSKSDNFKPKGEGFKGGRKPMGKSEGFKTKRDGGYKGKPAAERSYPKYNPNKVTGEIRLAVRKLLYFAG